MRALGWWCRDHRRPDAPTQPPPAPPPAGVVSPVTRSVASNVRGGGPCCSGGRACVGGCGVCGGGVWGCGRARGGGARCDLLIQCLSTSSLARRGAGVPVETTPRQRGARRRLPRAEPRRPRRRAAAAQGPLAAAAARPTAVTFPGCSLLAQQRLFQPAHGQASEGLFNTRNFVCIYVCACCTCAC